MRNNPLIIRSGCIIEPYAEEITIRGSLRTNSDKKRVIMCALSGFNCLNKRIVGTTDLTDFV